VEKIWLKQYETSVPENIDLNSYTSLIHLFNDSCKQFHTQTAFVNHGSGITYGELDEYSRHLGVYFQQLGLTRGARIAIMLPNLLQYPVALFAILRAGFVVVNTNPLYTPDELVHQINDSGSEVIVILANFANTVEKALPRMPGLKKIIITELGDLFSTSKRLVANAFIKYIKRMVPSFTLPHTISFRDAMQHGKTGSLLPTRLTHDDLAFLQYTGGTTGISKGAMLTHGNLLANVLQATVWIQSLQIDSTDIVITALPLYHIFSLTANCLTFIKSGAKNILITNPRDASRFIREIKASSFTIMTGVNTLFNTLINHPDFEKIDFSRLKLTLSGGMALQKSVAERWHAKTHTRILEAYGLTETSPAVTMNPMYLSDFNGSIGLPLPSTEISIRDDTNQEQALGESGELCVRGPQVMPGYWQRPDETELVFWPDGFIRTGDIVRMDEKGFIYLVDRKKDMIVVSGFNVYPNEVEQVISMMPGVLEVGVVGVQKNGSGEQVKACIVKHDPALTKEQVLTHARQYLTAYKIPKIIEFYDDLPKTNVGKILRRALRD